MGGQGASLGIVQKIEISSYKQMVYTQPNICSGEWDAQTSLGFWDTKGSPNLDQTTTPYNKQKKRKKENLQNCGPCCPGWPQSKIERKRIER